MNARGRGVVVQLNDGIVYESRAKTRIPSHSKKIIKQYKYKINNASYLTINSKNIDSAERSAKARACRKPYMDNCVITLFSITKLNEVH